MKKRIRTPTHPGGILKRHYLEPLNLTVSAAANGLSVSRKTLSKIVNGRGAITPDMALRLSKAFRTSPDLWINLQRTYDLWHVSHRPRGRRHVRILMPRSSLTAYQQPSPYRRPAAFPF